MEPLGLRPSGAIIVCGAPRPTAWWGIKFDVHPPPPKKENNCLFFYISKCYSRARCCFQLGSLRHRLFLYLLQTGFSLSPSSCGEEELLFLRFCRRNWDKEKTQSTMWQQSKFEDPGNILRNDSNAPTLTNLIIERPEFNRLPEVSPVKPFSGS